MNRYNWNINTLRKKREELLNISTDKMNKRKSKIMESSINTYNNLLSDYSIIHKKNDIDEYDEDSEFENQNEEILYFIENELPTVSKNNIRLIKESIPYMNFNGNDLIELSNLKMTNERMMYYVTKLFETIPSKDIKDKFLYVTDPKKELINIQYVKNRDSCDSTGYCYCDYFDSITYINILRENTFLDFVTIVHEIMHMILEIDADHYKRNPENVIYTEMEGSFANFLAIDFIRNRFDKTEADLLEENEYQIMKSYAVDIAISSKIIENTDKKGNVKMGPIKDYFEDNNMVLNTEELTGYLPIDLFVDSTYSLAYLMALDIFEIYKKDPVSGIAILERIGQKIYKESKKLKLANTDLTFYKDGYKNLKEKTKTISKYK